MGFSQRCCSGGVHATTAGCNPWLSLAVQVAVQVCTACNLQERARATPAALPHHLGADHFTPFKTGLQQPQGQAQQRGECAIMQTGGWWVWVVSEHAGSKSMQASNKAASHHHITSHELTTRCAATCAQARLRAQSGWEVSRESFSATSAAHQKA